MGSSTIFSGNDIKTLKSNIDLNGNGKILSGSVDPSQTATSAPLGSIYLSTLTGNLYRKSDAGSSTNWINIGNGGSGSKNYIQLGNFENNSVSGWSLGTIGTLTNGLPTGTPTFGSGADAGLSISTVSSGQLAELYSLSLVSTGATVSGNMLSTKAYSIDAEDQAKVLSFKLFYKAVSGSSNCNFSGTSSNSFAVIPYDVTNGKFIPGDGNFNFVQGSGVGIAQGTCQTAINTSQIRLLIYFPNATAGAVTLYIDDVYFGPQALAFGPAITDFSTQGVNVITATTTNPTKGTISVDVVSSRIVGDSLEVYFEYKQTANGAAGSGTYLFQIPNSASIDTTKLNIPAGAVDYRATVGHAIGNDSTGARGVFNVVPYDSTHVMLTGTFGPSASGSSAGGDVGSSYFQLGANSPMSLAGHYTIPVAGKSSNTVMSADSDTRVVSMRTRSSVLNSHATSGSFVPVTGWGIADFDSHAGLSGDTYTVPVTGFYRVSATVAFNASSTGSRLIEIYKNGIVEIAGVGKDNPSATNAAQVGVTGIVKCNSGDTLKVYSYQNSGGTLGYVGVLEYNNWNVERLTGPAVVAASESVNARYYGSSSSVSSSIGLVTYATKDYDTHNKYSAGVYTVPVSGKYQINAGIVVGGTYTNPVSSSLYIYKNSSAVTQWGNYGAGSAGFVSLNGSDIISLIAGDTVSIEYSTGATAPSISASNSLNFFSIARVGN